MAVKKKSIKSNTLNEIIERGGKTSQESIELNEKDEIRFTLRIPRDLMKKVDILRKRRPGNVSRNQFLIEFMDSCIGIYDGDYKTSN